MSKPSNPAAQRAAALAAIEARLKGESASSSSSSPQPKEEIWVPPSEKEDAETRRAFSRLLDRGIVRDNGYAQSADAVETLLKIANNILGSSEEKYRSLKATNGVLKNKVLSVKGGHDYLVAMGFRVKTEDFIQTYVLLSSMKRMHELKLGAEVLQEHLTSLQSRAASQTASKSYAAIEEAQRKAKALREIDEDRDKVKNRVERERILRDHREKVAREEAQKAKEEEERLEKEVEHKPPAKGGGRVLGANDQHDDAQEGNQGEPEDEVNLEDPVDFRQLQHVGEDEDQDEDEDDEDEKMDTSHDAFPKGGNRLGS